VFVLERFLGLGMDDFLTVFNQFLLSGGIYGFALNSWSYCTAREDAFT